MNIIEGGLYESTYYQGSVIYFFEIEYIHKLFCDTLIKNRCLTHDDNDIFYADDDHPSSKGADLINNLIIKKIETMNLKSKKNDLF